MQRRMDYSPEETGKPLTAHSRWPSRRSAVSRGHQQRYAVAAWAALELTDEANRPRRMLAAAGIAYVVAIAAKRSAAEYGQRAAPPDPIPIERSSRCPSPPQR
jgi:hypothetical protein